MKVVVTGATGNAGTALVRALSGDERVDEIAKSGTPEVNVQICKGAIVKFQGLLAIGNFSVSFPDDDVATYSFEMKTAAVPTIDNLPATS